MFASWSAWDVTTYLRHEEGLGWLVSGRCVNMGWPVPDRYDGGLDWPFSGQSVCSDLFRDDPACLTMKDAFTTFRTICSHLVRGRLAKNQYINFMLVYRGTSDASCLNISASPINALYFHITSDYWSRGKMHWKKASHRSDVNMNAPYRHS